MKDYILKEKINLLFLLLTQCGTFTELINERKHGANLINVLAAFFKPACVLIFLEAYFDSYKRCKCLNFLLEAQKQPQAIGH